MFYFFLAYVFGVLGFWVLEAFVWGVCKIIVDGRLIWVSDVGGLAWAFWAYLFGRGAAMRCCEVVCEWVHLYVAVVWLPGVGVLRHRYVGLA